MSDGGEVMTLAELRQAGRKITGDHEQELADVWHEVDTLRRDLDDTRARLARRTRDVSTLARVIRQLAEHVDFPLEDSTNGSEVPTSVQQSEPG